MEEKKEEQGSMLRDIGNTARAGKLAADIARGAATEGVYGAAVYAAGSASKWILSTVIIAVLLPAVILAMLPTIIFGPLISNDSGLPNGFADGQVMADNLTAINMTISTVMSEGLQDVMDRIDLNYTISGCDAREIINPYGSNIVFNANQFISMYCAKHSNDPEKIEMKDMEELLRKNKHKLYSMSYRDETRIEHEMTSPELQQGAMGRQSSQTTRTTRVRIYTIRYNGETFFANEIFELTDEMKALADAYSANLSTFLRDGIYQEIPGNEMVDKGISYENVVFREGSTPVVYFNQLDTRWINKPYGTDNIGGYACGPTSMCIVISSLTETVIEPPEMAQWAYENGYWCSGNGSYHTLIPAAAKAWGLKVEGCTRDEPQRIADALAEGKLVVALMSKGHFTTGGHYMVLRGITADGKVMVADPASYQKSKKMWDMSLIVSEASQRASAGGPFWIIG